MFLMETIAGGFAISSPGKYKNYRTYIFVSFHHEEIQEHPEREKIVKSREAFEGLEPNRFKTSAESPLVDLVSIGSMRPLSNVTPQKSPVRGSL